MKSYRTPAYCTVFLLATGLSASLPQSRALGQGQEGLLGRYLIPTSAPERTLDDVLWRDVDQKSPSRLAELPRYTEGVYVSPSQFARGINTSDTKGVIYFPTNHIKSFSAATMGGVTQPQTDTFSLDDLITAAKYVFVGETRQVHYSMEREGPDESPLRVRTVTFTLRNVLKGDVIPNADFTVKQFAPLTPDVKQNAQVLWFLDEPTTKGFLHTVGARAGYFQVRPDPSDRRYLVATNLNSNRALWSNELPLWRDDLFPENKAAEYLSKVHRPSIPPERREAILERGRRGCRPVPFELELLLAATYARLSLMPR